MGLTSNFILFYIYIFLFSYRCKLSVLNGSGTSWWLFVKRKNQSINILWVDKESLLIHKLMKRLWFGLSPNLNHHSLTEYLKTVHLQDTHISSSIKMGMSLCLVICLTWIICRSIMTSNMAAFPRTLIVKIYDAVLPVRLKSLLSWLIDSSCWSYSLLDPEVDSKGRIFVVIIKEVDFFLEGFLWIFLLVKINLLSLDSVYPAASSLKMRTSHQTMVHVWAIPVVHVSLS